MTQTKEYDSTPCPIYTKDPLSPAISLQLAAQLQFVTQPPFGLNGLDKENIEEVFLDLSTLVPSAPSMNNISNVRYNPDHNKTDRRYDDNVPQRPLCGFKPIYL
ncbi:MAG TPA: hypothetical protein VKC66_14565 [Xanthobacteraceae bacterium]|nr:hypothetical protein [Xanthobacteraceae bacterium]